MSLRSIDLNADVGEWPARLADGSEAELMRYVTSVNIACGGHAGDASTMEQTLELARQYHLAAGAHPSYPDRDGFGRTALEMPMHELQASILDQLHQLLGIAQRMSIALVHVKPHGALYHSCNHDREVAGAIAKAILTVDPTLAVIAQAGSPCIEVYRAMGLRAAAEAFADRAYEPDGKLRDRKLPGALLDSPDDAAAQAISIVTRGCVITASGSELATAADTLCIHSDTPNSASVARAVNERLTTAGVAVHALHM
jgi:UPF0271 protein